jgi:hypothetical protein
MKTRILSVVLLLAGLVMPLGCGEESPKSQISGDVARKNDEKPAVVATSETPVAPKPTPKPAEENPPVVESKPAPVEEKPVPDISAPFLGEKDTKTRQQQMCVKVTSSVAGKFEVSFRFYKDDGTDLIKPHPSVILQLEASKPAVASVYFKEPAGKYNCSVRMEPK